MPYLVGEREPKEQGKSWIAQSFGNPAFTPFFKRCFENDESLKSFPWPRIECFNCFISLLSVIKYQYQRRSPRNYVTFITRKWNNFTKLVHT